MKVRVFHHKLGSYGNLYIEQHQVWVSIDNGIHIKCEKRREIFPELWGLVEKPAVDLPDETIERFRQLMNGQRNLEVIQRENQKKEDYLREDVFRLLR